MAVRRKSSIEEALTSCFPREWVENTARETGAVMRQRKVRIFDFFWALVLGFGTGVERSIADLRRAFEQHSKINLAASAYFDRFTPQFARLMKRAVQHACDVLSEAAVELRGRLGAFRDLIIADASVIRLHRFLEKTFPATRTNSSKAAAKIHMVMSVAAISPHTVMLTPERVPDVKMLRIGPWVNRCLLLFDLGYFCYRLFARVVRNRGYFISRLKKNANPLIVGENRKWRGRARPLAGRRLREVAGDLKREEIDVDVKIEFDKRSYRGKQKSTSMTLRVVGILNRKTGEHHFYITNIPPEMLTPEDIAVTYEARWEVELLFKGLKNNFRMDQLPTSKEHIVEALLYAAILTLLVSRRLLLRLREKFRIPASQTPEERWNAVFQAVAQGILSLLLNADARFQQWRSVESFLHHEFRDPNVNRARILAVIHD